MCRYKRKVKKSIHFLAISNPLSTCSNLYLLKHVMCEFHDNALSQNHASIFLNTFVLDAHYIFMTTNPLIYCFRLWCSFPAAFNKYPKPADSSQRFHNMLKSHYLFPTVILVHEDTRKLTNDMCYTTLSIKLISKVLSYTLRVWIT